MFRKKIKKMPKGYDKNFQRKPISEEWRKVLLDYHFFCARERIKGVEILREICKSLKTKKEQMKFHSAMSKIDHSRSLLDDHYHNLISDKEFMHWGHLWYSEDGKIHDRRDSFNEK